MQKEQVKEYVDSMLKLSYEPLHADDIQNFLEALLGRPLEAVMPGADRAALSLTQKGAISEKQHFNGASAALEF